MTDFRSVRRAPAFSAFGADTRGLAATEFALILPILITLYFGLFELTRAIDNSRKVSLFARTVADLTGQLPAQPAGGEAAVVADTMNAIFDSAAIILRPFDPSTVQIVVSALGVETISGQRKARVCSSYAKNATVRPKLQVAGTNGLPATPAAHDVNGGRYVLAEISMPYVPAIGTNLYKLIFGEGGLSFSRQIPWAERNGEIVLPPDKTLCPTS